MGLVRRAGLKILKAVGRDFSIDHHWVRGHQLRLHAYKHKGYWWHGKRREKPSMLAAQKLLRADDTVVEVGGHIGYLTSWFAHLAGPNGNVLVFEPSDENYEYLVAREKR